MGCKASKPSVIETPSPRNLSVVRSEDSGPPTRNDRVYKLIARAHGQPDDALIRKMLDSLQRVSQSQASYFNPTTKSTPLHMAVRALDTAKLATALAPHIPRLIQAYPAAVTSRDTAGNLPIHYVLAPTHKTSDLLSWKARTTVLRALWTADDTSESRQYLSRNNVVFEGGTGPCTPLYRALEALPDDTDAQSCTVDFIRLLYRCRPNDGANKGDGDAPLSLLYRRFTRQFDVAEQFFDGDNSRPEVVQHRRGYKTAAGNTWKLMELLLCENRHHKLVHAAVQAETPPDLLRYIVETNAEDLVQADDLGNLPLHYAALTKHHGFPVFYSKYVVDELLYKFPEAARMANGDGQYALTLAVETSKPWIGGGLQSLYDAYPEALDQVNVREHPAIQKVLSMEPQSPEEKKVDTIVSDEHYDAVMLVQKAGVSVGDVVTSMWAHEEDAGVQMLGCVALTKMMKEDNVVPLALSALAAVVNAMKAHPNQVIVQEKACQALKGFAVADGQREISLVASGAVAAMVGAMQAHVSDAGVQEEACAALSEVLARRATADRATIFASVSGVTALLNALAAHPTVKGVQVNGCKALACLLTQYPQANLPELPRASTEPLLEAAKENYPEECGEDVAILMTKLA